MALRDTLANERSRSWSPCVETWFVSGTYMNGTALDVNSLDSEWILEQFQQSSLGALSRLPPYCISLESHRDWHRGFVWNGFCDLVANRRPFVEDCVKRRGGAGCIRVFPILRSSHRRDRLQTHWAQCKTAHRRACEVPGANV